MKPRREALIEWLDKRYEHIPKKNWLLDQIVEDMYEFDRLRAAERKAENDAAEAKRDRYSRDRSRGIYSRWATNASHEPTWCDEPDCPLGELPPGVRMYMEVDHEYRDPELDVPIVKMVCYDCAIAKGIPPVIGGQPKYTYQGAS